VSASAIHPAVQKMLDNYGLYVVGNHGNTETCSVIVSKGGKLWVMEVDKELDPTRFFDDVEIKHGPLLPSGPLTTRSSQ